jgi:catechol 2,3-dioxygenase-like lactoylglutathione lyase family enzyme
MSRHDRFPSSRLAFGAVCLAAAALATAQPTPEPAAPAVDRRPDTPGTGRFPALKEEVAALPKHVVYRPANLTALGDFKLGVVAWGNGGCSDDGASTRFHLLELASHGYLVIASGRILSGPGAAQAEPRPPAQADQPRAARTLPSDLTDAIDWALAENARAGSPYFGRIDSDQVALSGWSCGGLQALRMASDPRVSTLVLHNTGVLNAGPNTTIPGMDLTKDALAGLHTPVIYILGGPSDIAYSNGMDDYARIAHVPAAVANLAVGHGGTFQEPNGGAAASVAVSWLNWQLRGDAAAARRFAGDDCGLCRDSAWTFELKNATAVQPAIASAPSLVVGSGNYFSPIVQDLDAALAFYRDGLGLEVAGAPGDAGANPALRNMFGLPDASIRWAIARTPAVAGGVEIVEIGNAAGKRLERQLQDPGAMCLVVTVRDLDGTLARLKRLGTPIVSRNGEPVAIGGGTRIVVIRDPDGHFVELSQPAELPSTAAPASTNVIGVRLRLAVEDVETAVRLYRDALGFEARAPIGEYGDNTAVLDALGLPAGQYRVGLQNVPGSGLMYDFVDFKGVERNAARGRIQDFGSTRVQLRVRDIDAAIAAFERYGGEVVSTGGKPLTLPAGNATLEVAIVRDPNNLFVVLIEAPPAG